jgi:hypothetical protein
VNSIHHVEVEVKDRQELDLTGPPISVAPDRGGRSDVFDLWFEHMDGREPGYHHKKYAIYVFRTGHPVPWTNSTRHIYRFLGTVVIPSGEWHVYRGPDLGIGI